MELFSKKELSEADIKRKYITPAIEKKWNPDHIRMEAKITDGRINLKGNNVVRERCKYADYLLYLNNGKPIAVVEAKDNNHLVSEGIKQAMEYAEMMDIQFVYSSNGDAFHEYDLLTRKERVIPLDEFPTQEELIARYYAEKKDKSGLTDNERKVIEQNYYSSLDTYAPRYYQINAVNRTVEAIARGQKRLLLVMATGTGKTYVAFQIVYKLLSSKIIERMRVLYLTDRNILVDQSLNQDFGPLKDKSYKVNFADKDCLNKIKSHEINFALYHQMVGQNDEEHFKQIPKEYFDLIIVDECHRGSAKEDSNWRRILDYFSSATQIGMTATPKESTKVSNIDYFGDPVYTYSLKQGIDDGFLAPFKVINVTLDVADGWRPYKGQKDIFGKEIEDRIYNNRDFDYPHGVILQDRIDTVAKFITDYLKKTDRMQKTIVFCATEDAAERMRFALANLNSDIENSDYVVRITGSDDRGKGKLDYFISANEDYPVIVTTSELLSTGADCKMTKLIVLDKYIESMITFKQIIGRGTRIREDKGKMHFTVMDFRGVTSLFADPEWDGPVEQSDEFVRSGEEYTPKEYRPPSEKLDIPTVDREGCRVNVDNIMISDYIVGGKVLHQVDIIATKRNILGEYASLSDFINKWNSLDKKIEIREALKDKKIDLEELKKKMDMTDVDDFDFICHIVYGKKPLTRAERARNVKKKDFFSKYSGDARAVLEILLDKYMDGGIIEMENIRILSMKDFAEFGKPAKIVKLFGGKEGYEQALRELEDNIYGVEAV